MNTIPNRITIPLLFAILACVTSFAQEPSSVFPGGTTLGERTIPAPAGLSPEMLEVVKERQIPPAFPVPETTEKWLKFQSFFDEAGEKLAREAATLTGTTYEVRKIAGVRTYLVTPKKINKRFADRVFVHAHGGAWVFGGETPPCARRYG